MVLATEEQCLDAIKQFLLQLPEPLLPRESAAILRKIGQLLEEPRFSLQQGQLLVLFTALLPDR